jgi:ankyrin repeat protein
VSEDFFQAVKQGDKEEVGRFVENDSALVNARDANGVSAVLWSLYRGHREVAELLVEKGASLNIFEAAAIDKRNILEDILEKEPNLVREYSPDGFTALGLACFFGSKDAVEVLLEKGADPNAVSKNQMRVTPLHSAVAHRDGAKALEMSRTLLAHKAQVNVAQEGGWTPLHQAAAHGQTEIVRILLEQGADAQAMSADGRTPVQMASEGGHEESVKLLQQQAT